MTLCQPNQKRRRYRPFARLRGWSLYSTQAQVFIGAFVVEAGKQCLQVDLQNFAYLRQGRNIENPVGPLDLLPVAPIETSVIDMLEAPATSYPEVSDSHT
jgi:hypothetical protein